MALIFRLAGKKIGSEFFKKAKTSSLSFIRPVTLVAKPAQAVKEENYDEHNMKLKRPQSPHLTIYSFQLTSMLSISHRFTGMALSAYMMALGLGAVALPNTIPVYIEQLQALHPSLTAITAMKFVLAFPLTYHFWNGIRHLLWDQGAFLSIRQVYITGYLMLLLAFSSAVALSVM